jgi:hypothetical protein
MRRVGDVRAVPKNAGGDRIASTRREQGLRKTVVQLPGGRCVGDLKAVGGCDGRLREERAQRQPERQKERMLAPHYFSTVAS